MSKNTHHKPKKTAPSKAAEVNRVVIDAAGRPVGRLATEVALILRGKDTPSFKPYVLPEKKVIVKNVADAVLTGRKAQNKPYWHFTGFPGGMRVTNAERVLSKDPTFALRHAVSGMLPKNRLRARMLKNLVLYKGEEK